MIHVKKYTSFYNIHTVPYDKQCGDEIQHKYTSSSILFTYRPMQYTLREMYTAVVFGLIIPNLVQYVAGQIQSRQFGDK